MGKEQQSNYYDEIYSQSKRYADSYRSSAYLPTWTLAMQLIDRVNSQPSVLDIGCGTGQFADFITHHSNVRYTGIDFSAKAIELARARNYDNRVCLAPPVFSVTGILAPFVWQKKFDVYVAMETLEHIENDLDVVSRIPQGALVIITVPSFDDEGHVRFFKTKEEVLRRYGPYLGSETRSQDQKCVEIIRSWFIIYGHRNSTPMPMKVSL